MVVIVKDVLYGLCGYLYSYMLLEKFLPRDLLPVNRISKDHILETLWNQGKNSGLAYLNWPFELKDRWNMGKYNLTTQVQKNFITLIFFSI